MGEFALRAPQIGEAIHKVGIVRYLKEVGQTVALDEPIVVVESDKASFEIESPVPGVVLELLHGEGIAVEVGAVILKLATATEKIPAAGVAPSSAITIDAPTASVQALDSMLSTLRNGKLSPRQRYQQQQARQANADAISAPVALTAVTRQSPTVPLLLPAAFTDEPLSPQRQQLNRALAASQSQVVPANLQLSCPERHLQAVRQRYRQQDTAFVPSRLELIAWTVVQAMKAHPLICSRLLESGALRRHHDPGLGLAVALPNDALTTACVPRVFASGFADFAMACRHAIGEARHAPQPPAYHPLAISDLSAYGIEDAIPVVVAPSTATLFVGAPRDGGAGDRTFRLSLSFDHRILNGAGGASFLGAISRTLHSEARLHALLNAGSRDGLAMAS